MQTPGKDWPEEVGICRTGFAGKVRARKALVLFLATLPCFAAEPSTKPRPVTYIETGDFPHVYIGRGFEVALKLDKSEQIVLASTGIADFNPQWLGSTVILKSMGTATGLRTDLRILCASGNGYTFIVEEVSNRKDVHADLTVLVHNGDDEAQRAMLAPPKLFTAEQVAEIQNRAKEAEAALQKSEQQRNSAVAQAAHKELLNTQQDYVFYDRKGEDFHPRARHDEKFTVVDVQTQEVPSFFELKDGKLSLVQATYSDGHYIIPKVIDSAQLRVGKSSIKFKRVS